jgi:hypothetical protein
VKKFCGHCWPEEVHLAKHQRKAIEIYQDPFKNALLYIKKAEFNADFKNINLPTVSEKMHQSKIKITVILNKKANQVPILPFSLK